MIRKTLTGTIAALLALTLTACGAVSAATASFVGKCQSTYYEAVLWSPDGQHIALEAGRLGSYYLYVMSPDGSGARQLAAQLKSDFRGVSSLQWLPDSQALAFTDGEFVTIVSLDGTTTQIKPPASQVSDVHFSPDGTMIAYSSNLPDMNGVFIPAGMARTNIDGAGYSQLSDEKDIVQQWSPDGESIVYLNGDEQQTIVSTISWNGRNLRHLVEGGGPVNWSPDGQWISYFSPQDDGIHIIRPDGTGDRLVTTGAMYNQHNWLPDGQHISFVGTPPQQFLKVTDITTLETEEFTRAKVTYRALPSWSPDGTQVAFIGFVYLSNQLDIAEDLFVMNHNGTGLRRLTDNPGKYQCMRLPF